MLPTNIKNADQSIEYLYKGDIKPVFAYIVNHLGNQKQKSTINDNQICAYRSNTLSCAVGCIIPDHMYTNAIEGIYVDKMPSHLDFGSWLDTITKTTKHFLVRMQYAHDNASNEHNLVHTLYMINNEFKLDFSIEDIQKTIPEWHG